MVMDIHYTFSKVCAMFRISRRLDYGLHLMLALAAETNNQPQSTASLSQKMKMPLPFMHQIAHALMQSGLIKATPGPRGGLRLNRPAADITILNIVEALEGPIALNPSRDNNDSCSKDQICPVQSVWDDLQQRIVLYFESITLAVLLQNGAQMVLPVSMSQSIAIEEYE
jgi:Rrf2 family protein